MGHDITAYVKTAREVAYHRRNAFNPENGRIYEALDAEHHNGGVSGLGTSEEYCRSDIESAMKVCESNGWMDELDFFQKIIDAYPDKEGEYLEIHFG